MFVGGGSLNFNFGATYKGKLLSDEDRKKTFEHHGVSYNTTPTLKLSYRSANFEYKKEFNNVSYLKSDQFSMNMLNETSLEVHFLKEKKTPFTFKSELKFRNKYEAQLLINLTYEMFMFARHDPSKYDFEYVKANVAVLNKENISQLKDLKAKPPSKYKQFINKLSSHELKTDYVSTLDLSEVPSLDDVIYESMKPKIGTLRRFFSCFSSKSSSGKGDCARKEATRVIEPLQCPVETNAQMHEYNIYENSEFDPPLSSQENDQLDNKEVDKEETIEISVEIGPVVSESANATPLNYVEVKVEGPATILRSSVSERVSFWEKNLSQGLLKTTKSNRSLFNAMEPLVERTPKKLPQEFLQVFETPNKETENVVSFVGSATKLLKAHAAFSTPIYDLDEIRKAAVDEPGEYICLDECQSMSDSLKPEERSDAQSIGWETEPSESSERFHRLHSKSLKHDFNESNRSKPFYLPQPDLAKRKSSIKEIDEDTADELEEHG